MISWNPKGDLVGVNTKNHINIIEHREDNIFLDKNIYESSFSPKFIWVDDNSFTALCSNSRKSPKMLKLWDLRKIQEDNSNEGEISSINIES